MVRATATVLTLVLSLGSVVPLADAAEETLLAKRIDAAVSEFSGSASIALIDLGTGYRHSINASRVVPAASLYKLGVMVEAYRRIAEGSLSFGDTVTITDDDLEDDGYYTPSGTDLSVQDAVARMITISDNSPARALTRMLDARRINATMQVLGLKDTRINYALPDEEQTAPFNTTTARDMAALFEGLARGTVVGPSWSAQMLDVLGRQQINDRLPAGLSDNSSIAHKTGDLGNASHDVGLVTSPMGKRVVAMLTVDAVSYDDVVSLAEQLGASACQTPLDDFAARFARPQAPPLVRVGALVRLETTVRNASSFTWSPNSYLVERLRMPAVVREIGRIPLPPAPPGVVMPMTLTFTAPADPGIYVFEAEVIDPVRGGSGNLLSAVINVVPTGVDVGSSGIPASPGQSVAVVPGR